jgi:LPXTG-motif cell wall-anchored protein
MSNAFRGDLNTPYDYSQPYPGTSTGDNPPNDSNGIPGSELPDNSSAFIIAGAVLVAAAGAYFLLRKKGK